MRISKEFTRNDRTVHVDSGFYPVYKQNICNTLGKSVLHCLMNLTSVL